MLGQGQFWEQSLWVGVGGFFGATSRYAINQLVAAYFPTRFPYGTLLINLTGSFLLGGLVGHEQVTTSLGLLCGTGFMGAFTTFSTFKNESVQLGLQKNWASLLCYLGLTYTLGIGLAFLGYALL